MLLLDTCTLLWLASDQHKLSEKAVLHIKNSPQALFVSAITAFEIAIKTRSKKIALPLPALDWYSSVLDFHGITEIEISGAIAIAAVHLPPLHNDPCDRIIIATAQLHSMQIITCDTLISAYKQAHVIW